MEGGLVQDAIKKQTNFVRRTVATRQHSTDAVLHWFQRVSDMFASILVHESLRPLSKTHSLLVQQVHALLAQLEQTMEDMEERRYAARCGVERKRARETVRGERHNHSSF